jgi:hypothetical protein
MAVPPGISWLTSIDLRSDWWLHWLMSEVLDTFHCQRPKSFALYLIEYHSILDISNCGKMDDVLREKFSSFWEQNASHHPVNLPAHGLSGLRCLRNDLETLETGTQPYNPWQGVSNRHLWLFLLVSPPQLWYSTDSEWLLPLSSCPWGRNRSHFV